MKNLCGKKSQTKKRQKSLCEENYKHSTHHKNRGIYSAGRRVPIDYETETKLVGHGLTPTLALIGAPPDAGLVVVFDFDTTQNSGPNLNMMSS